MSELICLQVNGEEMRVAANLRLTDLIEQMALADTRIAVEVNEEIVSRSSHDSFQLNNGDKVEVVQAIGGG